MPDYRRTLRARRQSWFGLKRFVKTALSLPGVHALLRLTATALPRLPVGRLPAPARLREVEGRADGVTFVLLRPDRCEIAKELYWGKDRRPRPHDALALDLVVRLAREADVLLDVGAYTGVFTVASTTANPRLTAHAFEIVPAVADALAANLERNGVADRVTVHRAGLGEPGTSMRVPVGDGGSALPSFYSPSMVFDDGVEIPFLGLDDVVAGTPEGARVVIKVDVEGGEADVFRHGQDVLRGFRPDVLCEVLPGADGVALTTLLAQHGLRFLLVREHDLLPCERIDPHPVHRDWLVTARKDDELRGLGLPVAG